MLPYHAYRPHISNYPLLIFTTHCYYHSIGILHIKWYATQLMFFLKKFFQLNHIVNLLQVIFQCIVNIIYYNLWWLHNSENYTYPMCSLPTCNHIIIANDIISPCTLLYLSNKIIPYHTIPENFLTPLEKISTPKNMLRGNPPPHIPFYSLSFYLFSFIFQKLF